MNKGSQCLSVGTLNVLPESRQAFLADQVLLVTGLEFNLLSLLTDHSPEVVTKDVIAQHLYGGDLQRYQQSICTHVSNLRKKIRYPQGQPDVKILSVRGQGYALISSAGV